MSDVPNHDSEVIAVAVCLNVLGTLAVGIRVVSKYLCARALLLEDWLLITAWAVATAEHTATGLAYQWGLGRHRSTLTDEQLESFGRYILVLMICQPTALALSKLSLLRLLHRIFITRTFHITVYLLSAVVLAWYLSILFADIFICTPVEAHWDPRVGGSCGNMAVLDVMSPIPWILTDFAILVAPLPLVWRLHIPRREKAAVLAIFLAGAATLVVSCIRYKAMFFDSSDMTWTSTAGILLTCAEAQTAVIWAAMVAFRSCFKIMAQRLDSPLQHREDLGSTPHIRALSPFAALRNIPRKPSERGFGYRYDSDATTLDLSHICTTELDAFSREVTYYARDIEEAVETAEDRKDGSH